MTTGVADRAAELLEEAARLADNGDDAAAGVLALEAAALLGPGTPDRHSAFVSAATLLATAGRHSMAADAWAGAAADAPDDATRALTLSAEGDSARLAGLWWRAVNAHEQAFALAAATDASQLSMAVIAQNLAVTLKYVGRFDDARSLYRRALEIAEGQGDRRLTATICHNLGGLAHASGDYRTGIRWARRSVHERQLLDDALGLAADRGALAGLLVDVGELEEASDLLAAVRRVLVDHLGEDHHEVAVVDGNLAAVAMARGDLATAERHARAALRVKERCLGVDHPELGVTLTTLGSIRRLRGDRREAQRLHGRALAVLAPAVDPSHPLLRTIEDNLTKAQR